MRSPSSTTRAATPSSAPRAATGPRSSSSIPACRSRCVLRELFARNEDGGARAADPIFIVGLPRSGSTLIEQILASHSAVEGTHELADIPRIVADLKGRDGDSDNPRYPAVLAQMTAGDFRRLGEKYLTDTRGYRTGKARFIDKMPNNFRHIGLIHLMLPNAKIIDARREPMACCFGNLKQLFAKGQEFTYSIEDIARYYRTYLELMRHWDAVLPGRVLRVQHEDVVEDLEGNVRRLLEYCGLEFEPRLCRVPQDRAQRAHRELRAGAPADLSRGPGSVASLRALARAAARGARRCPHALSRVARGRSSAGHSPSRGRCSTGAPRAAGAAPRECHRRPSPPA